MRLVEKTFSTSSWPKDLILDLDKSNWREWSTRAEFFAKRQGFLPYLDGSFPCPDKVLHPEAHYIWFTNDIALQGFIEETISSADLSFVYHLSTGHEMFTTLRNRHEKLGPYTQLLLLKEYLNIFFDRSVPFRQTLAQLDELHLRITNMGPIDNDRLRTFGYIHALGNQFIHLQSTIQLQSESPNFTSRTARHLIEADDSLIQKTSASEAPSRFTALAATPARPVRHPCGNCNRTNHTTEYCIHPGGKLAGKTIDEARAIQLNHRLAASQGFPQSRPRPPRGPAPASRNHALVASHSPHLPQSRTVTMDGTQYTMTPLSGSPSPSPAIPDADPSWQHDSLGYSSGDETLAYSSPSPHDVTAYDAPSNEPLAYSADHRDSHAYISAHHDADPSWQARHTAYTPSSSAYPPTSSIRYPHRAYLAHIPEDLDDPADLSLSDLSLSSPLLPSLSARSQHCNLDWDEHLPSAYSSSLRHASGFPFIFDSGASCHISPARTDFKTFRPISSQRVTGLGGSFVSAVGCGSVDISMATGHKLTLHNVLYIPTSDVRLVSVHALNFAGNFASHFDTTSCWVTDRSGATIARGDILPGRNLYYFPSVSTPSASSAAPSPSVHIARPVPNVETWHRRLGHCNTHTIIEMARSGVVEDQVDCA